MKKSWRRWMQPGSRVLCLLMVVGLAIPAGAAVLEPILSGEGKLVAGQGWLETVEGVKVAHFRGTPWEIGAQNAALLVMPNEAEMTGVFNRLDPSLSPKDWRDRFGWAFKNFYASTKFLPSFKQLIPQEYQEEMRGFIQTASRGKESGIDRLLLANAFQDLDLAFACSSFAAYGPATADGQMYVGRNLDNPGLQDLAKYQVVAFYEPERGYPFVTLTTPSFVGVMHGMNSQGLVVAMNYSVATGEERSIDGVPFTIMLRQVLQYAGSVEEAVEMIKTTPRTVGLNILLAGGKTRRAVVVEAAANRFAVREANDGIVYATNRFQESGMKPVQGDGWLASAARDRRLAEIAGSEYGRISLETVTSVVRDKFAAGSPGYDGFVAGVDNGGTMASIIFEPDARRVWIARLGTDRPAPDNDFVAFDLNKEWGRRAGDPDVYGGSRRVISATPMTPYFADWLAVRQAEVAERAGRRRDIPGLLEPVLARHPQAEEVLSLLGAAYLTTGRSGEGVPLLERLLALPTLAEPHHALEAHYWLGLLADVQGRRQEAVEHYRAALAVPVADFVREGDNFSRMSAAGLAGPLKVSPQGQVEVSVPAPAPQQAVHDETAGTYEGQVIRRIIILGASRTREGVILKQLPFQEGDLYSTQLALLAEARLNELDIFDDRMYRVMLAPVPHEPDSEGVDLVIRVAEAGLLYKDPLELAALTLGNAMDGTVQQTFRNLGGTGVNLSLGYTWGDAEWGSLSLSGPSPWGMVVRGSVVYRPSDELLRVETGAAWHPDFGWRLTAGTGLHRAGSQEYGLVSGGVKWDSDGGGQEAQSLSLEVKAREFYALDGNSQDFAMLEGQVEASASMPGDWNLSAQMGMGVMPDYAPANYRFRLGGFSDPPLRGYASNLVGSGYLSGSLELQHPLGRGFSLALFVDTAQAWEGGQPSVEDLPFGMGAGLTYQPPLGPPVRFEAAVDPVNGGLGWRFGLADTF